MFNHVFALKYWNCLPNKDLLFFLQEKTSLDIIDFGIPALPQQLKIELEVMSYNFFKKKLYSTNLSPSIRQFCVAYSDSSIHCAEYASIPQPMPIEKYLKAVRHECIHVLQHLVTRIKPQNAVWLYESVACARAEQIAERPTVVPSWEDFITNFYGQSNCYALAYVYGCG